MNKTLKTEILAGLASFMASSYIVVVNPAILSQSGMSFNAALTSTVLVCFVGSLLMGIYANNPIIVAPGMGLNAFFTFTAVKHLGLSYQEALGAVFWSGILFLILSFFKVRESIIKAIPIPIRYAVSSGIGLFICFIGLQNAHIVQSDPVTLVRLASIKDPNTITFLLGLLITAIFLIKKIKGGLLYGIFISTILAIPIGRLWGDASLYNFGVPTVVNYKGLLAMPDFSLFMQAELLGSLKYAFLPVIFVFAFTDLFDSLSTVVGLSEAADLNDENKQPKNLRKTLVADALVTTFSGLIGSSPGTAYIESAVGISQGGRTGKVAITAAFLFLPMMFFSPLLSLIPAVASSIALVLVGAFMLEPIKKIDWQNLEIGIPCFLALVLIPFSFSISQGIVLGLLSWTVLKVFNGKAKEIPLTLIIINIFSILALCF